MNGFVIGIAIGVVSGLFVTGILASGTVLRQRARLRTAHGHLHSLRSERPHAEIVVPSIPLQTFVPSTVVSQGQPLINPTNVLFMPMSEGGSISEIHFVLRTIWKETNISLIPHDEWHPGDLFTISVGGPSVNSVSYRILKAEFPEFGFNYPDATSAHFRSTTFLPELNVDGALTEDFGFIFVSQPIANQGRRVVLCGISAFGTEIAAKCFLGLLPSPELSRRIKSGQRLFAVARGRIEGLKVSHVELIHQESL